VLCALDLIQKTAYTLQSTQNQSHYTHWTTHTSLASNRKHEGRISPCVNSVSCHGIAFPSISWLTLSQVLCVGSTLQFHLPSEFPPCTFEFFCLQQSGCSEVLFSNRLRKDALRLKSKTIVYYQCIKWQFYNGFLKFFHRHETYYFV